MTIKYSRIGENTSYVPRIRIGNFPNILSPDKNIRVECGIDLKVFKYNTYYSHRLYLPSIIDQHKILHDNKTNKSYLLL